MKPNLRFKKEGAIQKELSTPFLAHCVIVLHDGQEMRFAEGLLRPKELREIEKLVEQDKTEIERKWNEFFSRS